MESNDPAHKACFTKPKPKESSSQTRITFTPHFGFAFPPRKLPPRTPAPNVIKRTTHTPFFSTTDRSYTSFFRLPYELRLQVYCYLLSGPGIQYRICLETCRLVLYRFRIRKNYPFLRHRLYPAILECSRLCNEEGAPILYGENRFSTAWCHGRPNYADWLILNSWPLSKRNLQRVSSLTLSIRGHAEDETALRQKEALFPRLKYIRLTFRLSVSQWENFLNSYADVLKTIQTIELHIDVDVEETNRLFKKEQGEWQLLVDEYDSWWALRNADALCYRLYEPGLQKIGWLGKKVEREFFDLSTSHGLDWNIIFKLS